MSKDKDFFTSIVTLYVIIILLIVFMFMQNKDRTERIETLEEPRKFGEIVIMGGTNKDTLNIISNRRVVVSANNVGLNIGIRGLATVLDSGQCTHIWRVGD